MKRMTMRTTQEARNQLTRIIREYKSTAEFERDHTSFRNLIYGFSVLLQFFRTEAELEIQKDLDYLKDKVNENAEGNY